MKRVIGIDLGTSNCAVTIAQDGTRQSIPLEQVLDLGTTQTSELLPSILYRPVKEELEKCSDSVVNDWVAGMWARQRACETPDRTVSSAKSWLCQSAMDRSSPFLPYGTDTLSVEEKISPVNASANLLKTIGKQISYNEDDQIVVTVPASFDEVARNLTLEAARKAGLGEPILLEEPLAATYAWIAGNQDWQAQVEEGDVILVCDIGGGTTDFSLLSVESENGTLQLERIAVGNHLLLGGDNIDLALAWTLKSEKEAEGIQLDDWQFQSLVHQCRNAKEQLLGSQDVPSYKLSVAGKGSSLFASTISFELTRTQVERLLFDGFFPESSNDEFPDAKTGIASYDLDYENDAAITKHLNSFLAMATRNVQSSPEESSRFADRIHGDRIWPTKVLFNGGVVKPELVRARITRLIGNWSKRPVTELSGANFDRACANGAAYYGEIKLSSKGLRIRSGTSHSYYLGLQSSRPAIPGVKFPINGLCVVPQGTEEGIELNIENQMFNLVVGKPVSFRFFSSATRKGDGLGDVITDAEAHLDESGVVSANFEVDGSPGEVVPVRLDANISETGSLTLSLKHLESDRRFRLEFNLR